MRDRFAASLRRRRGLFLRFALAAFCLMVLRGAAFAAWDGATTKKPAWDGVSNRYVIRTAEELAFLAAAVNARVKDAENGDAPYAEAAYVLAGDVDLSGRDWTPIGAASAFEGTFDGAGYAVSGMKIASDDYRYSSAGLFGALKGAGIKNLGVTDFTIDVKLTKGTIYAGGLAGQIKGKITGCYAAGDVFSSSDDANSYAGGLAGSADDSEIAVCYATGKVYSAAFASHAGGLAGLVWDSRITTCYATGDVSSFSTLDGFYSYAGGLAARTGDSEITTCYATGKVYSSSALTSCAGGLVGNVTGSSSSVKTCYAWGAVTGGGGLLRIGGLLNLVSGDVGDSSITNNYWRGDAGDNGSLKGIGVGGGADQAPSARRLDGAAFRNMNNFKKQGWNFGAGAPDYAGGDWCYTAEDNHARPHLRAFSAKGQAH